MFSGYCHTCQNFTDTDQGGFSAGYSQRFQGTVIPVKILQTQTKTASALVSPSPPWLLKEKGRNFSQNVSIPPLVYNFSQIVDDNLIQIVSIPPLVYNLIQIIDDV